MSQMHSLVKWISGDDKDTYSIVPTNWIKNFDLEEYKRDIDPEETYVIDWRTKKNPPKGGYPCFDGLVIKVSGN